MFTIEKRKEFKYAVKVRQARDSGALEMFEFIGTFKRLDQPEVQELLKTTPRDRQLLDKVWTGWTGVKAKVEKDGIEVEEEMPVTPVNREALLKEPGVEVALINAWLDAVVFGPAKN